VRAEPDDDAEQVTQALLGEPLTVEETNGDWARVRTAYDYPGWIRIDVLAAAPEEPLENARGQHEIRFVRLFI
jgi:SH3-like domain-containing protein